MGSRIKVQIWHTVSLLLEQNPKWMNQLLTSENLEEELLGPEKSDERELGASD